MDNQKVLKETSDVLAEHIQKIIRKGANMTVPDIDILNKILCGIETLQRIECGAEGYSETSQSRGHSQSTGHHMSRAACHDSEGNSTRYYDGGSGNAGYSGHSIHDRMVACLENMMGEAQSDYERQQIRNFIQKAREF